MLSLIGHSGRPFINSESGNKYDSFSFNNNNKKAIQSRRPTVHLKKKELILYLKNVPILMTEYCHENQLIKIKDVKTLANMYFILSRNILLATLQFIIINSARNSPNFLTCSVI